jgi:hypothetical protein
MTTTTRFADGAKVNGAREITVRWHMVDPLNGARTMCGHPLMRVSLVGPRYRTMRRWHHVTCRACLALRPLDAP